MNTEDIRNGNELIKNLMGSTIKIEQEDVKDIPLAFLATEDLKFHVSWKWLMPAVIQVEEELGHSVLIQENLCRVMVDEDNQFEHEGETKIEGVWQALVDFLEWNENQ